MTPDKYQEWIKARWGEWHIPPSRYVNDMIEVHAFCQSVQAQMRFARNMDALREQTKRVEQPRLIDVDAERQKLFAEEEAFREAIEQIKRMADDRPWRVE